MPSWGLTRKNKKTSWSTPLFSWLCRYDQAQI